MKRYAENRVRGRLKSFQTASSALLRGDGLCTMDALYRYGRARLFRFCLFLFGVFQVVDLGDGINQFAVAAAGF